MAQREKKIKNYSFLWEEYNQGFPIESREGSTFTLVQASGSESSKAWIIGGLNHTIVNRITKFDTANKSWS